MSSVGLAPRKRTSHVQGTRRSSPASDTSACSLVHANVSPAVALERVEPGDVRRERTVHLEDDAWVPAGHRDQAGGAGDGAQHGDGDGAGQEAHGWGRS